MTAIPRDPPADTPGIRTLGTAATQAAAGNDTRFPSTGALTVKASYQGTPQVTVFYAAADLAGNVITARTSTGVVEDPAVPGLYLYDQIVTLDEFITFWDENDGVPAAQEVIATKHVPGLPHAPTSVTAVAGNQSATVSFTPGDNGGAAVTQYVVTATDTTTPANGGQTASGATSPIIVGGLHNGDNYTFTVHAHNVIGDSPESSASSGVVPAAPAATVPGAPLACVATQTASGQVTVTFSPPISNGGTAITSYVVSAIDETNSAHNTTHTGNSPNVLTGLFNERYHFTVHAVNAIGAGPESASSGAITLTSGTAVATFATSFSTSTKLIVDATGSNGNLTWEIDGIAQTQTDTIVAYGPLTVGPHHVKLTATSGGASTSTERDVDVPWVAEPLHLHYGDQVNGGSGGATGTGLPIWAAAPPIGPWPVSQLLNEVEGYPALGDNQPRIVLNGDASITLTARSVDYVYAVPTATQPHGQKYRPMMNFNTVKGQLDNLANGRPANAYLAVADANVPGNLKLATDTLLRFFRYEFKVLGTNPDASHPPGYPSGITNMVNFAEAGYGGTLYNFTPGTNTLAVWFGDPTTGITKKFDSRPFAYDSWYNYVLEILLSPDPTVGYVRLYRDGSIVTTNVPSGTILTPGPDQGKYFQSTVKLDASGNPLKCTGQIEVYRDWNSIQAIYAGGGTLPDVSVMYRNIRVGPSLSSVYTTNLVALPTITSISPTSVARGASATIQVTGTGFLNYLPGVTAIISGPNLQGSATGITITSVTYVNATRVDVAIIVDSAAPTGLRTITVTNPSGGVVAAPLLTVT